MHRQSGHAPDHSFCCQPRRVWPGSAASAQADAPAATVAPAWPAASRLRRRDEPVAAARAGAGAGTGSANDRRPDPLGGPAGAASNPDWHQIGQAWAFITLCHWKLNSHHVAMGHLPLPGLGGAESDDLLAAMRPYFEEDGIQLYPDQPGRWLAQGDVCRDAASAATGSRGRAAAWKPGYRRQPRRTACAACKTRCRCCSTPTRSTMRARRAACQQSIRSGSVAPVPCRWATKCPMQAASQRSSTRCASRRWRKIGLPGSRPGRRWMPSRSRPLRQPSPQRPAAADHPVRRTQEPKLAH